MKISKISEKEEQRRKTEEKEKERKEKQRTKKLNAGREAAAVYLGAERPGRHIHQIQQQHSNNQVEARQNKVQNLIKKFLSNYRPEFRRW